MQLPSYEEFSKLCNENGIVISENKFLSYQNGIDHCVSLSLPTSAEKVSRLLTVLLKHLDDDEYKGSLLWLREWGIWSPDSEEVGVFIFEHLLNQSISNKYCLAFNATEFVAQKAFLSLPMLYDWDCYVIPNHWNYCIFINHHKEIKIFARTSSELERIFLALQYWDPRRIEIK